MRYVVGAIAILFAAFFSAAVFAQSGGRVKPKIKDFGASLKRPPEENLAERKPRPKTAADEETIVIETNLVVTNFLVIDKKGNSIYGLTKDDFTVAENGEPQEIQTFTLGDDARIPRSIVLIIDYSGSQLPFIETSVEAAKQLVDKLRPNDLMAIVTDDVEIIAQFTSDKELLKKKLDSLKKNALAFNFGRSLQFSALYAVLNEMFDEEDVRPIILFQTDGDQIFSLKGGINQLIYQQMPKNYPLLPPAFTPNFGFNDLLQKVEKSNATIYSIVPGFRRIGLSEEEKRQKEEAETEMRRKLFEKRYGRPLPAASNLPPRFSEAAKLRAGIIKKYYPNGLPDPQTGLLGIGKISGGWIDFLEKPEDAEGVYSKILSEINKRYIIGYAPTNEAKDGKKRTVKIEVKNHPEYIVWGRKVYYAPLSD